MRWCEQCGLSIGEAATYCPVCGTRADASARAVASAAPRPAAARSVMRATTQVVGQEVGPSCSDEDALSLRQQEASLPMREAGRLEKTDPARAVALYREAILRILEATADPLDEEWVRHDLLRIFDRLSLVLKREGLSAEALEEIESAASLGLLDCLDRGIKGHREALKKRRESLLRALDAELLHH